MREFPTQFSVNYIIYLAPFRSLPQSADSAGPRTRQPARACFALGRKEDFEAKLDELRAGWGGQNPRFVANIYAYTGQFDGAFDWLERVVGRRNKGDDLLIHSDPFFNSLHDDQRWGRVLRRIGLARDQLEELGFLVTLPR